MRDCIRYSPEQAKYLIAQTDDPSLGAQADAAWHARYEAECWGEEQEKPTPRWWPW